MHQRHVPKNCSTCKQTNDNKYLFGTRKHSNKLNQREENEYDCHYHKNQQNLNLNKKNKWDDYQYPRNRTNYGHSNKSQDYQLDERFQNNRVWNGCGFSRKHNPHKNSYESENQHEKECIYPSQHSQDEDDGLEKEDGCHEKQGSDHNSNGRRRKGCRHRKCKNVDVELENTSCPPNHFLGNPNIATNYISSIWNRRMSMYPWGYPSPYAAPLY